MPLVEPVIRPPSEAESLLLQVTLGCSARSCSFCGAYRGRPFRIRSIGEIGGDIDEEARAWPEARRVFLLDGDALAAGNELIVPVLERLNRAFPRLGRIASYANGFNISSRSDGELRELGQRGLRLVYVGLESGSQRVLNRCRKRATVEETVTAVRRSAGCGIKSSVIVLLGLGGSDLRDEHVSGTVAALNRMQPRYLSFLTLMLIPGTPLARQADRGDFKLPVPQELLREARDILQGLELRGTIFRSNHASNYLPLAGRFPQDKQALLASLEEALKGKTPLKAERLRGL